MKVECLWQQINEGNQVHHPLPGKVKETNRDLHLLRSMREWDIYNKGSESDFGKRIASHLITAFLSTVCMMKSDT